MRAHRATVGLVLCGLLLSLSLAGPALAQVVPATPAQGQGPAAAPPGPSKADMDLVKALRAGGHAIVMRHAPADPDKADTDPLNFKNLKKQQPLTDAGRQAARTLGDWWRAIGLPVGEVLTSQFQRAVQTAQLLGLRDGKAIAELTEGSLVVPVNEQRRRSNALKQLAAAPLRPGTNRLLVTHRANITQAFGKEWFEVKEGEASIFRIENGTYTLVARLQMTDWARLAAAAQASTTP